MEYLKALIAFEQIFHAYASESECHYLSLTGKICDVLLCEEGIDVFFRPFGWPIGKSMVISGEWQKSQLEECKDAQS